MKSAHHQPVVLVVEDEAAVLHLLEIALPKHGFKVILAGCGEKAITIYREHREQIALVLMDVQMPGLDGPGTLHALREINPAVRCCFMSGYTGRYNEAELRGRDASFIEKPFSLTDLSALLTSLLTTT